MRLAIIFVLALSIHILHAQDVKEIKVESFAEKMRPTLMSLFGEEWTIKLIGKESVRQSTLDASAIALPAIPVISDDARSTAIYQKKEDRIKLSPKDESKYFLAYVKEIYEVTRLQKPNDDELAKLMNVISQGGSREGIYHSLVLDSTYGGMENYDKSIKENSADFAVYFYDKYLGKKVKKESLRGMNVFTLKRLMADRTLDVIEAYGDKREDIEKWYAVASSDLAAKFPQVWSSKLRKDTALAHHKNWASKVPLAHIKSEIVIKLHMALNSMM